MFYDVNAHKRSMTFPTGTMGQISFERLVGILREIGELSPNEDITHFAVNFDKSPIMIRYRISPK